MRAWAWLKAKVMGYSWNRCPICGGGFSLNETSHALLRYADGVLVGSPVCPVCIPEAKRRNVKLAKGQS